MVAAGNMEIWPNAFTCISYLVLDISALSFIVDKPAETGNGKPVNGLYLLLVTSEPVYKQLYSTITSLPI